ncbi:Basic secretory protease (Fragments) [Linum perenne]
MTSLTITCQGKASHHHHPIPISYTVSNMANQTAGGARFDKQVGPQSAVQTMVAATNFTWTLFNQTNHPSERKNITQINLFIDDDSENLAAAAHTENTSVHISANFIGNYTANLRRQFNGIIYQEIASIWQWTGKGQAPNGLVTGIAHYVRLQARYGTVEKVKPGEGDRWDEGNGVTARFLDYCNKLKRGFVGELNKKMRHGYTDGFFLEILGKPVDLLWSNYKERNNINGHAHHQ